MSGLRQGLYRIDASGVPLLIARFVLGGMFIWMGLAKVADPVDFLKLIHEYRIFPGWLYLLLNLTAVTLPWLEVLCGVLLVTGVAVRGAALLLFGLLTFFTIAIILRAVGIHQTEGTPFCSIRFDCGCGAGIVWMCRKIPENAGLWLLALLTLISRSRRFCLRYKLAVK